MFNFVAKSFVLSTIVEKSSNKLYVIRPLFQGVVLKQRTKADEKRDSDAEAPLGDVKAGLSENEVDEEELMKKRNKNRLPEKVYRMFLKNEAVRPELKTEFRKNRLKRHYGHYGAASGLNPGILWPTREELKDIIEHDKLFHPPLKETLEKIRSVEAERERERQEYQQEVEQNLSKYDKWVQDYYDRIGKKDAAAEVLKKKRAELIEEISDHLGYDVDPADPKFKEAVEQREKEKKKALKEKKQKESYDKMLQKLAEIAKQQGDS